MTLKMDNYTKAMGLAAFGVMAVALTAAHLCHTAGDWACFVVGFLAWTAVPMVVAGLRAPEVQIVERVTHHSTERVIEREPYVIRDRHTHTVDRPAPEVRVQIERIEQPPMMLAPLMLTQMVERAEQEASPSAPLGVVPSVETPTPLAAQAPGGLVEETVRDDLTSVLVNLGYPKGIAQRQAEKAMADNPGKEMQTLIRAALQRSPS